MVNEPLNPRYHSLDVWRGVACVMVIMHHATAYVSHHSAFNWHDPATWIITTTERMWAGVPIFFVISGYCISAAADASRRGKYSTYQYFSRRARRIYPPYLICFVLCIALVAGVEFLRPGLMCDDIYPFPNPAELNLWRWAGNITLTEGWRGHFVGPKEANWLLGSAWSLGFEEQFYAIMGMLLFAAPKRLFAATATITGFVVILQLLGVGGAGLFIDGRWLHFAAGILVYYALNYTRPHQYWLMTLPLLLGIGWMLCHAEALKEQEKNHWQDGLAAFSFALLILSLHRADPVTASATWTWPLRSLGIMCYSVYLVHWPLCKIVSHVLFDAGLRSPTATVLVTVPLCLIASISAGYFFHAFIERRFLNPLHPTGKMNLEEAASLSTDQPPKQILATR